jgi:hypothetical protein
MRPRSRSPAFWIVGGLLAILLVACGAIPLYGRITRWIEGDGFRALLDRETSKGLKFQAHYASMERVGLLGLHTDSFHGEKGTKTIVTMDAHDISGWFNPLGIALRHWEIHAIRIKSGTVMLQKTEATPGEPKGQKPIPWTALFWPYRVELEDVKVGDADVLFHLQEKESGIYHTVLEITPNGRDFEYDAQGGIFRTPMTPPLNIARIHLLIRKPRLYCPIFVLKDDPEHPEEQLQITGDAGLQDDRSIHVAADLKSLSIPPWLPEKYRANVLGHANGHLDYHSTGTGLETAEGRGSIESADAVLHDLPIVQQYVKITGSPDPGDLHLRICRSDLKWEQGAVTLEKIDAECAGVFKLTGNVTMAKDGTLSGELRLGLTGSYIKWLPTAKTAIFTEADGDYSTTTIHISGTAKKPVQDLSSRVLKELAKSPGTAIKLFFNAL